MVDRGEAANYNSRRLPHRVRLVGRAYESPTSPSFGVMGAELTGEAKLEEPNEVCCSNDGRQTIHRS
jgi:hypothetical protein